MLNQSSAVVGSNLAQAFVEQGIVLVPKANTLVSELGVALSNNLLGGDGLGMDAIASVLVSGSTGYEQIARGGNKEYVSSSHDTFMDNYIDDLAGLVAGYVGFARGVVNKEVTALKEAVEDAMASYKHKEPEEFFSVTYFELHEVFVSHVVESEISGYVSASSSHFESMSLRKIVENDFDLGGYLMTGDQDQDRIIASWMAQVGGQKACGYLLENVREYEMSVDQLLDYALVNYLFYRNLTIKTDLEVGLSLSALRSKASVNRDHFGKMLVVLLEQYKKDVRNGRLMTTTSAVGFSYFNAKALSVTIYSESFAKLAEGGGSIEMIFGHLSSVDGGNSITVDRILADKEGYLAKWHNTRSLYLILMNSNRLDIFKQILRDRFEASLDAKVDNGDEQEYLLAHPQFIFETKKLGNAYIDALQASQIDDLDTLCLELVAKIRYSYTNGYYILKEMSELLKMSEKIEPMEAALYATIKYVTDFLLESVDVVRN